MLTLFDDADRGHGRPRAIQDAVDALAGGAAESRGAVYTRPEVVAFILALCGYTADADLAVRRVLEPSFGEGEFLAEITRRLLVSYLGRGGTVERAETDLAGAVCGVELHRGSFDAAHARLVSVLTGTGLEAAAAGRLVDGWLVQDDVLLARIGGSFDYVVGNPPYLRQEAVPAVLLAEYRRLYPTVYDRADLYVPIIELSLRLLAPGGALTFICSDRWTKNKYGGPLRALVARQYRLRHYVDMTDTPAFVGDVVAYPAVFTVERPPTAERPRTAEAVGEGYSQGTAPYTTLIAGRPQIDAAALTRLASAMTAPAGTHAGGDGAPASGAGGAQGDAEGLVHAVEDAVSGEEPWLLNRPDELELLRRLEYALPTLTEAGLRVGIGVATGADKVFIGPADALGVEESCWLPVALPSDIASGRVEWAGRAVINPFEDDGALVELACYPRLAAYLHRHEAVLRRRHVAKDARRWYRTIDRIWPALLGTPKLLIPDIKGTSTVAYDEGTVYPGHNLYYVVRDSDSGAGGIVGRGVARNVSGGAPRGNVGRDGARTDTQGGGEGWDLRALQAVLRSAVAEFFVGAYAVRMRGGYLRFQAQYLRRIRVPHWADVPDELRRALAAAAEGEREACDAAAFRLYGLSDADQSVVRGAVYGATSGPASGDGAASRALQDELTPGPLSHATPA
ncbi:MAG TPA: Eco57I restriction-modification methylase domain-containing protein [Rubricoccaceae bacterium]|jgi:hypothetical protein